jgi:hypothetical protein
MVQAVPVRRPVTLIVAFAVAGIIAVAIGASMLMARPVAVVQVEPRAGGGVTLTYLTSGARSVDIVERRANGNRVTISGIVSDQPQIITRGPWSNASARPVQYDIVAKSAFGFQAVDSVSIHAAVAPAPVPNASTASVSDSVTAVRTYYTYWSAKRFSDMWNLLSPAFKSKTTYDAWVGEHSYDKSVTLKSATDNGNGRVSVVVVAVDQDPSGAIQSHTYNLIWTTVSESGRTLLDSVQ